MKVPYGESNFKTVVTQGFTYIDKTAYIERLERASKYQILLRPRRFGKSLFLSMLWHYYDVAYQADFADLFGTLYIGKNPTLLHNTYQVLFLDFSGIDTDGGHDAIYQRVNEKLDNYLQVFLKRYAYAENLITEIREQTSPASKMERFFSFMPAQKLLLLIDEYDHFANSVLAEDMKLFLRILGKGGFMRSLYETLKTATLTGALDRFFITGVTPLMLDSMTSGFNIGYNLSLEEDFNAAIGFTHPEMAGLLKPLVRDCQLDAAQLMQDVAHWYNGYRFHPAALETVYNADMALYFVDRFDRKRCAYPKRMLDENIASDYGKIMRLFSIGNRDENFIVLDELLTVGEVIAEQRRKFDFEKGFDRDDFISLLAYMGFVTAQRETLAGDAFAIPNQVIRELYFQAARLLITDGSCLSLSKIA